MNAWRKKEILSCQQSSMSKNEEMIGYETICRVSIQYILIASNMLSRAIQHFHQHKVYDDECVNHMPNTLGIEQRTFSRKMVAMTAMPQDITCTVYFDHTKYVPNFHEVFDIGFTL